MILVSVHELSKAFAARALFEGLTFSIEGGDRIGLIGPNGAGKSTLLKILASEISADEGKVVLQRGLRVGFLEQDPVFEAGATVRSTIREGAGHLDSDWEKDICADELIAKLGLVPLGADTLVASLSGGWKKRVALGRELAKSPDLLLLDEPTNHLDIESILWLEELIQQASYATVTITHDRLFLTRVSNRIIELDRRHPGGLLSVRGDYTDFLEVRGKQVLAQEKREVILKNTLRRETEWLRQGAKARTTKQQARIHRAGDLKDEVAELQVRNQVRAVRLDFQSAERSPKKLIDAKNISKVYGAHTVFSKISLTLTAGQRLGLLGRNGAGKSTLIRVLLGLEPPTQGGVTHADQLSVAYFDQTRDALDPETTVSKTLCPRGDKVEYRGGMVHIRSYLDRFLFTPQQMDFPVGSLSGGEQARLLLARLMLTQANVLVLDEPTNDLDMATLNVLEDCLREFAGAVILVTHDRYFMDQVATKICALSPTGEGLVEFADLMQWEQWWTEQARAQTRDRLASDRTASKSVTTPEPAKARKLTFKEQHELKTLEPRIQKAEAELESLTTQSSDPETLRSVVKLSEITKRMAELQAEIHRLYDRWAELSG